MDFLGLNEDVKRLILDYLSQQDLFNLCVTCSHLYHLAQPVLYSSVEFPSGINSGGPPKPHRVTSLVRAILSRPHLATHIRRLAFLKDHNEEGDDSEYRSDHQRPPEFLIPSPDMEAAVRFIKKCDVPYRNDWLEALQASPMDAYLAILLTNLPAVTHLRIEAFLLIETLFVGRVLRSLLCNIDPIVNLGQSVGHAGSLRVLRDIALCREDHSPVRNTETILPVFYLPAARRISIYLDDPAEEFRWPTDSPPQVSDLESLEVEGLQESQLRNLLSATPSLPSLTYIREYWVESSSDPAPLMLDPVINLQSLSLSLATVKDSLVKLELRTYGAINGTRIDSEWESHVNFEGPLPAMSFTDFPNLRILEVPCEFIMGFPVKPVLNERLPRSLEEFRLSTEATSCIWSDAVFEYSCEFPYLIAMWEWLAGAETHTPKVKKFVYLAHAFYADDDYLYSEHINARAELRKLANKVGIEYMRLMFSVEEMGWVEQY